MTKPQMDGCFASKVLLGAPRMNTITDLWNSLHFLKPGIFSGPDTFDMWFQQPPLSDIDDIGLSAEEEVMWVRELNASHAFGTQLTYTMW